LDTLTQFQYQLLVYPIFCITKIEISFINFNFYKLFLVFKVLDSVYIPLNEKIILTIIVGYYWVCLNNLTDMSLKNLYYLCMEWVAISV
jgi:hypothetical protein